jgi:hypothetical protein
MPKGFLRKAKQEMSKIVPVFSIRFEDKFRCDFSHEGYTLKENTRLLSGTVDLRPLSFIEDCENDLKGIEIVERAIKLNANLGQLDAEKILENQDNIPVELRHLRIIFTGTVWLKNNTKIEFIPCLSWNGKYWVLDLIWLGFGWGSSAILLAPYSPNDGNP